MRLTEARRFLSSMGQLAHSICEAYNRFFYE